MHVSMVVTVLQPHAQRPHVNVMDAGQVQGVLKVSELCYVGMLDNVVFQ